MRNGCKVFDADTHVHATAETLDAYLSAELRARLPDLAQHTVPFRVGWAGETFEPPYRHLYRFGSREGWGGGPPRILGDARPREGSQRHFQRFMGARFPSVGGSDCDADVRIRDMDE